MAVQIVLNSTFVTITGLFHLKFIRTMLTPVFGKQQIAQLTTHYRNLRDLVYEEVQTRLSSRSKTNDYLATDDEIFQPFIESYVLSILTTPFDSIAKEIGGLILEDLIKPFEKDNHVKLNKNQFYFALAMLAIRSNDETNAMIYWELANKELHMISGATMGDDFLVDELKSKFTMVFNPIRDSYESNIFINTQKATCPFIRSFIDLLSHVNGVNKLHLLSASIKNRKIQLWLRNQPDSSLVRLYSQELINSLSILSESILKKIPGVSGKQFGNIINGDLPSLNPTIAALINGPTRNMFTTFPTHSIPDFNINFPLLISSIESGTLSIDEIKAYYIYGTYMIRNQVLHQFDDSIIYYNNVILFEKAIGLLFANISVITTL